MSRSERARGEGSSGAGDGAGQVGSGTGGADGPGQARRSGARPRSPGAGARLGPPDVRPPRYGRYLLLLAIVIAVLLTINTAITKTNGARGVPPGELVPPFALPLATGDVNGDANVATHANDGAAGKTPACAVRGAGILNVCELYEEGPLVLALFIDAGSCPDVLSDMQALARAFPAVRFAGVAIKGERGPLRTLIARRGLTSVSIGFDRDGVLAGLYKVVSCPQVNFVLPGGEVQSAALLSYPSTQALRARVGALIAAAMSRGWKAPGR
jgi:hypothetical protein